MEAFLLSYHLSVVCRALEDPSVLKGFTAVAGRAFLSLDQYLVTGNPFDRIHSDLDERTTKLRCEVEGSIGRSVKFP